MTARPGIQQVLARILADPATRRAWDEDPLACARACGLSGADAARLAATGPVGVQVTRRHIGRKRIRAVKHFLPMTFHCLERRGLDDTVCTSFVTDVAPRNDPAADRRLAADAGSMRDHLSLRSITEPALAFPAGLAEFEWSYSSLVTRPLRSRDTGAVTEPGVATLADGVELVLSEWDFPAVVTARAYLDSDEPPRRTVGILMQATGNGVRVIRVPPALWHVLAAFRDGVEVDDLRLSLPAGAPPLETVIGQAVAEGLILVPRPTPPGVG